MGGAGDGGLPEVEAVGCAEGIVVEALPDRPGAVLDDAHAAEVVGHIVEYLVRAAAVDQPSALPACALKDRRAAGTRAREDHVAEVEAGRAAVIDLRQRAVGQIGPLGRGAAGAERAGQVQAVPDDGHASLWIRGEIIMYHNSSSLE